MKERESNMKEWNKSGHKERKNLSKQRLLYLTSFEYMNNNRKQISNIINNKDTHFIFILIDTLRC